jgi:hypothetical protein
MISRRLGLGPNSFVVELGSNGGYLLQHSLPLGVQNLGIEPAANVAKAAQNAGIPTRVAFFNSEMAQVPRTTMSEEDPQRSSVRWQELDVDQPRLQEPLTRPSIRPCPGPVIDAFRLR